MNDEKSGSQEYVAWMLASTIANVENLKNEPNYRKRLLDLYAECLHATQGRRGYEASEAM